jgi:hypothetical protein
MTTTAATEAREIVLHGKCKTCRTVTKVIRPLFEGSTFPVGGYSIDCADCGAWIMDTHEAKTSTTKCGAKCRNAVGPACSCECGGRNHSRRES